MPEHMLGALGQHGNALGAQGQMLSQIPPGKLGHREDARAHQRQAGVDGFVSQAEAGAEGLWYRKNRSVVDHHKLVSFENGSSIAKVDQAPLAAKERQIQLLPQVALVATDVLHRDAAKRGGRLGACWHGQHKGQTRQGTRTQQMVERSQGLCREAFNPGDGTLQEATIDHNLPQSLSHQLLVHWPARYA